MGGLVPGLGQRKVCNDQNMPDGNMDFIPPKQKPSAGPSEMRLRPGTCRMACVDKCVVLHGVHRGFINIPLPLMYNDSLGHCGLTDHVIVKIMSDSIKKTE